MEKGAVEDASLLFPAHYAEIFRQRDAGQRFRLIRSHVHPRMRSLLVCVLDRLAEMGVADPLTHSRIVREPRTHGGHPGELHCALYGLRPHDPRDRCRTRTRPSSGRPRRAADFEFGFFATAIGIGLELHVGGLDALDLFERVYRVHRDGIDALLRSHRLGVEGPADRCLLSLRGMIRAARQSGEGWLAVYVPPVAFPIREQEFLESFTEHFLALYLVYEAMVARVVGMRDSFSELFCHLQNVGRGG